MPNPASQLPRPDQRYLLEKIYQGDRRHQPDRLFNYSSGDSVQMQPGKLWVVQRGLVQLNVLHASGDEVIVGLVGPSMPFGEGLSCLSSYSAKALTALELLCYDLADVEASPELSHTLFPPLIRRLSQTEAILTISSHRRVEDRLRHLLLLLKQEIGQPTSEGIRLSVKLTHQQLASAIGTSRVTITRLLGKLRGERWVNLDRDRHLVIATPINFS
jgi:CRP-like cAMP-binding protein